jgi:hypothetical protein
VDKYQGLERAARDAERAAGLDPSAPAYERLGGLERSEEENPMVEIDVATPFDVQLRPDQPPQHFDAGVHEVTDDVAQHPVVQANVAQDDDNAEGAEAAEEGAEEDSDTLEGSAGDDTLQSSAGADDAAGDELDPALVDAMTDEELRAFITKRDGRPPHHKLGHDKLLAHAKALVEA